MKRWLKNHVPDEETLKRHPSLVRLKQYFEHHPNLWTLNRSSTSRGVALGLLVAFIPIPFQMLIVALLAIVFRANVPIAIAMTWINNPFTFVPINYFIYLTGAFVLGENGKNANVPEFRMQFDSIHALLTSVTDWIAQFGKAYLVGIPIVALGTALIGFMLVMMLSYSSVWFKGYRQKRK